MDERPCQCSVTATLSAWLSEGQVEMEQTVPGCPGDTVCSCQYRCALKSTCHLKDRAGSTGMSHQGLDVTVAALTCPVLVSKADFPQHRGEVEFLYLTADSRHYSLCDDLTDFVYCFFQSKEKVMNKKP